MGVVLDPVMTLAWKNAGKVGMLCLLVLRL